MGGKYGFKRMYFDVGRALWTSSTTFTGVSLTENLSSKRGEGSKAGSGGAPPVASPPLSAGEPQGRLSRAQPAGLFPPRAVFCPLRGPPSLSSPQRPAMSRPPAAASRPPEGAEPRRHLAALAAAARLARPGPALLGSAHPGQAMAASAFCCLRWCRDGAAGHIPLKEMPAVQLDTQRMGERGGARLPLSHGGGEAREAGRCRPRGLFLGKKVSFWGRRA